MVTPGKRTSTINPSRVKKLKKIQDRVIQQQAFKDLLLRRNSNGGILKYGDCAHVSNEYKSMGFKGVTVRNLRYRLSLLEKKGVREMSSEIRTPAVEVSVQSSGIPSLDTTVLAYGKCKINDGNDLSNDETKTVRHSDCKGSSTKKDKEQNLPALKEATTKIAVAFLAEKQKAMACSRNVPPGTLKKVIETTTKQLGLPADSINSSTVLSRVKRGNLSGVAHQKVSPLGEVEPLIVEKCLIMAKAGMALTKANIIELVSDLITGTKYAVQLQDFKEKRHLVATEGKKIKVGTGWYKAFMERNKDSLKPHFNFNNANMVYHGDNETNTQLPKSI